MFMKFFIFSILLLLVLLAATITLGVIKSFSPLVIVGIVLVCVSLLALIFIFIKNKEYLKNNNNDKKD